jgi:hypothetical protein
MKAILGLFAMLPKLRSAQFRRSLGRQWVFYLSRLHDDRTAILRTMHRTGSLPRERRADWPNCVSGQDEVKR